MRLSSLSGALGALVLTAGAAQAQYISSIGGFASLPSFAWSQPTLEPGGVRWDGSYARITTGFNVTSSRHFGTSAGPTIGLEAGRMWQEGNVIWGIAGAVDYQRAFGGYANPGFNQASFTRDFAGAVQLKAGVLVTPEVLVYTKVGAAAINENWRWGPTPFSTGFSRNDVVLRPEARAGVEWAVTNNLTLGLEVGVVGQAVR